MTDINKALTIGGNKKKDHLLRLASGNLKTGGGLKDGLNATIADDGSVVKNKMKNQTETRQALTR